jgi:hypothetical protein
MIPFLRREVIRQHATEAKVLYEKRIGRPVTYPLNVEDFFYVLFGLETVYDTEGRLNNLGDGIIGCLFPDGHRSPFGGKDKIIAVNLTPASNFDPTVFSDAHTIAHEGMGHYVLHFLKGVTGKAVDRPTYCRTGGKKDPLEWQSDFAAGELIQPADKIAWILDGKQPGEIVNLELYEKNYREYFGANRMMMEARLKALDYKLLNAKYSWADYAKEQEQGVSKRHQERDRPRNTHKPRASFDDIFGKPVFSSFDKDFSSIFGDATTLKPGWKSKLDRMVRAEIYQNRKGKPNGR